MTQDQLLETLRKKPASIQDLTETISGITQEQITQYNRVKNNLLDLTWHLLREGKIVWTKSGQLEVVGTRHPSPPPAKIHDLIPQESVNSVNALSGL